MASRSLLTPLLALGLAGLASCSSHAPAAMAVDTPLVPYQAPDLAALTGDDFSVDDSGEDAEPVVEPEAVAPAAKPASPPAALPAAPAAAPSTPKQPAAPAKPGK